MRNEKILDIGNVDGLAKASNRRAEILGLLPPSVEVSTETFTTYQDSESFHKRANTTKSS